MAKSRFKKKIKEQAPEFLSFGPAISRGSLIQMGKVHTYGRPNYSDYYGMLEDPTISNATELITNAVCQYIGVYEHNNSAIKDYITRQFENLEGDLNSVIRTLASCFWLGMSAAEICAEVEDGELSLKQLIPIPVDKLYCRFKDEGRSYDVEEYILNYGTTNEVVLPDNKMMVIRNSADYNHPYGTSRLACVKDSWEHLKAIKANWKASNDRYSSPMMVYHLENPKQRLDDGQGGTITAYENANRALSGTGLVKGTICCGSDSVEIIPASDVNSSMVEACQYYEKLIYRGLLIPSLLTDSGDVGSYALGEEHSSLFYMVVAQLSRVIKDAILEQLVRPLVSYQFGEQEDWGDFAPEKIEKVEADDVEQ